VLNVHPGTLAGQAYTNYTVIQFNYSPTKPYRQTPYVNGTYYTYRINRYTDPFAYEDPEETPGQILPLPYSSVAGFNIFQFNSGEFFTALTQDDVGGLRYLYSRNQVFVENLLTNAVLGQPIGNSPWVPFFIATNIIAAPTNFATVGTNAVATSNLLVTTALRPGIDKLIFHRVNFDSLLGNTFVPITNSWNDAYITNGQIKFQAVQRVITLPDILFIVDDVGFTLNGWPVVAGRTSTTNWLNNDALNGFDQNVDGGPGVIQPPVRIYFSNRLPHFRNSVPFFLSSSLVNDPYSEAGNVPSVIWGSFDATTNPVVVYPHYMQMTVDTLRAYTVGGGTP
jgi:hypothetical protein